MASLQELIDARDVLGIKAFMSEHDLVLDGNKIVPKDETAQKRLTTLATFFDQRQYAGKIRLNALYGALLNPHMRLSDPRLGQSVTLTGRSIVRHMGATVNQVITGDYNYIGDAIIAGDTDSVYFSAYEVLKDNPAYADFDWSSELAMIGLYDEITDVVNNSFSGFLHETFNTSLERGALLVAGRELLASKGLFIKKKKYALLCYDFDGVRQDVGNLPGKLKAMGLDLKRSDTPKYMQKFLENILLDLLQNGTKEGIFAAIKQFRKEFKSLPAWEKGSPKKVNKLTDHHNRTTKANLNVLRPEKTKGAKITIPGHVKASLNWNALCDMYHDLYAMRISDGMRIVVCKLKPNAHRMDSIAYPTDEMHLPAWFLALPFDHEAMEEITVTAKLENLVGCLDWDLSESKDRLGDEFFTF